MKPEPDPHRLVPVRLLLFQRQVDAVEQFRGERTAEEFMRDAIVSYLSRCRLDARLKRGG